MEVGAINTSSEKIVVSPSASLPLSLCLAVSAALSLCALSILIFPNLAQFFIVLSLHLFFFSLSMFHILLSSLLPLLLHLLLLSCCVLLLLGHNIVTH